MTISYFYYEHFEARCYFIYEQPVDRKHDYEDCKIYVSGTFVENHHDNTTPNVPLQFPLIIKLCTSSRKWI